MFGSRRGSWLLALPALLLGVTETRAVFVSTSTVSIGNESIAVPVALSPDGKLLITNGGKDFVFKSSDGLETFTVNATGKADPFLSYTFSAVNASGGTLPFTFTFATPVTPTLPAGTLVTSSLSGSLTAGDTDGVTVSPNLFSGGISEGSINGVSLSSLAVGSMQASPSGVSPYPPSGTFNKSAASADPITSLDVTVSFNLTGGGDGISGSGLLTTNAVPGAVPEPASMALMVVGALGLGFGMRRKLATPPAV